MISFYINIYLDAIKLIIYLGSIPDLSTDHGGQIQSRKKIKVFYIRHCQKSNGNTLKTSSKGSGRCLETHLEKFPCQASTWSC